MPPVEVRALVREYRVELRMIERVEGSSRHDDGVGAPRHAVSGPLRCIEHDGVDAGDPAPHHPGGTRVVESDPATRSEVSRQLHAGEGERSARSERHHGRRELCGGRAVHPGHCVHEMLAGVHDRPPDDRLRDDGDDGHDRREHRGGDGGQPGGHTEPGCDAAAGQARQDARGDDGDGDGIRRQARRRAHPASPGK